MKRDGDLQTGCSLILSSLILYISSLRYVWLLPIFMHSDLHIFARAYGKIDNLKRMVNICTSRFRNM